jgi:hexosaminidase
MKKVYSYEPCPKELDENEKTFIMGAQGNIWTEYIPNYQKVEYMALPRMSALSEVLWLPSDRKNYENFSERIQNHFKMLDFMGINHAIPEE